MISSIARIRLAILGISLAVLASVAGCGGGSKVEGTVMYKGQPVEGAGVVFMSDDGTVAGQAQTDAKGKYKLASAPGKDSIAPGNYIVLVSKTESSGGAAGDPASMDPSKGASKNMADMMMKGMKQGKSLLPAQFGSKATSTLKKTVPSGDYNLDLGS
jgi:hypothetical protein